MKIIERSHAWCDNCRKITRALYERRSGDDLTGEFTDLVDIVCTECPYINLTLFNPKGATNGPVPIPPSQPLTTGWRSSPAGVKPRCSTSATTGRPSSSATRSSRPSRSERPDPAQPYGTSSPGASSSLVSRSERTDALAGGAAPITAKCSVIVHLVFRQLSTLPER
jgi:hypothetical protein